MMRIVGLRPLAGRDSPAGVFKWEARPLAFAIALATEALRFPQAFWRTPWSHCGGQRCRALHIGEPPARSAARGLRGGIGRSVWEFLSIALRYSYERRALPLQCPSHGAVVG
jgi:hypothetical protein